MNTITFRITGKQPLMMHNPQGMHHHAKAKEKWEKSQKLGKKKKFIPAPEVEAGWSCYRLPNKQLYLKSEMFRGAMLNVLAYVRIGTGQDSVKGKTVLAAAVFMAQDACPLVHPKTRKPIKAYVIDSRRAVVQGQGIIRSRARVDVWSCDLPIKYDEEVVPQDFIENYLARAGRLSGVGDQRPSAPKTPGPFGTFAVEVLVGKNKTRKTKTLKANTRKAKKTTDLDTDP